MMKNSNALSLVICIGILIVVGCSCPKMAEIQKELDKAGKTTPSPTTGSSPAKSGDAELTLDKYNQLKNGMTLEEVREIIGSDGSETSSGGEGKYRYATYKWDGGNYSFIIVSFTGGKVSFKVQNGLK
jgi:hypothetical protein